jgi:hypothetical protein
MIDNEDNELCFREERILSHTVLIVTTPKEGVVLYPLK